MYGGAPRPDPSLVSRLRGWVEDALGGRDDVTISIAQLACREPGCPPVETCISLLRHHAPSIAVTIHAAVADITREQAVRAVLTAHRSG